MSLHPEPIGEVPVETAHVARAAFPKGTVATRLRDEFCVLYEDEDFRMFWSARGQPGLVPWCLALVKVFQFLKQLSDRQADDAVRARIDLTLFGGRIHRQLGTQMAVVDHYGKH